MKEIELPFDFNASDSDLEEYHISIPKGFEAEINKDNVVLKKVKNEDDNIRQKLIKLVKMSSEVGGFALHKWEADEMLAWLEKQTKPKPTTWNENDDYNLESCVLAILHSDLYVSDDKRKLENWINSIKSKLV